MFVYRIELPGTALFCICVLRIENVKTSWRAWYFDNDYHNMDTYWLIAHMDKLNIIDSTVIAQVEATLLHM